MTTENPHSYQFDSNTEESSLWMDRDSGRRGFLKSVAYSMGATLLPRAIQAASSGRSTIEVMLSEPIGRVSPDLYGYLLENLGTVIYDGVWVGEDSKIPNIGGIRKELIDGMRDIKASVIRWPGGDFADDYDWKDGVGPRASRPRRTNAWSDGMSAQVPAGPQHSDPNYFGTPEFMQLCRLSGGRPFLGVNTRELTSQDFSRWVEYCNAPVGSTTLADLRKTDGSVEPYGVRYFSIGNEVWAAGMTVEEYAAQYKLFVSSPHFYGVDLSFIACGPPAPFKGTDWIVKFLSLCRSHALFSSQLFAISLHYYANEAINNRPIGQTMQEYFGSDSVASKRSLDAVKFVADEWYEVLANSAQMDSLIAACWREMAQEDPQHLIKIAVDEWATIYAGLFGKESGYSFGTQPATLRDALAAAITLDIFHNHCDKVALANFTGLINLHCGLFRAQEEKFFATPIYYVFQMYAAHQSGQALRTTFDAPSINYSRFGSAASLAGLVGSASLRDHTLTLTVVNPHVSETQEPSISIRGGGVVSATVSTLTHSDIHVENTFEQPRRVTPVISQVKLSGSRFQHRFPPASVSCLTLKLRNGNG